MFCLNVGSVLCRLDQERESCRKVAAPERNVCNLLRGYCSSCPMLAKRRRLEWWGYSMIDVAFLRLPPPPMMMVGRAVPIMDWVESTTLCRLLHSLCVEIIFAGQCATSQEPFYSASAEICLSIQ